jgi:hypothetical protein
MVLALDRNLHERFAKDEWKLISMRITKRAFKLYILVLEYVWMRVLTVYDHRHDRTKQPSLSRYVYSYPYPTSHAWLLKEICFVQLELRFCYTWSISSWIWSIRLSWDLQEMAYFSGIYADARKVQKGLKSDIFYKFICAYCHKYIPVVRTPTVAAFRAWISFLAVAMRCLPWHQVL